MPLERPCSPGHCLGMLNEYMRTDILRRVHQAIHARLDQRGTRSPRFCRNFHLRRFAVCSPFMSNGAT